MKTQEEYALEIDEIVRRDVESRQSDWFKIDKEIFMQPENKNKAFILGTRKTGCDLIILGGTNCDEGSMDWLFGSLGNENFYICQPLSFQKSSQEIEKVNPLYVNQKGILKIEDGLSAWENQIEKYRFATESERQKLVDALKASKEPEAKEYLKRFFGIEEKPKYEFKPFDKVLVRKEGNKKWNISLFAREIVDDYNGLPYKYECSNGTLWDYCIHFEGNECLLGTTENPEK